MTDITSHRVEKIKISKYWLDTGTFVCKLTVYNNKEVRTEITLFSDKSEPFIDITENTQPIKS